MYHFRGKVSLEEPGATSIHQAQCARSSDVIRWRSVLNRGISAPSCQRLSDFFSDEGGTTVIEYGLIAAFISFAIFSLITSMGDSLNTAFTDVNSDLETAIGNMQP